MNVTTKKILALILSFACLVGLFAGCTPEDPQNTESNPTESQGTQPNATETQPGATETQPNATETQPNATETQPNATETQPTEPVVTEPQPTEPSLDDRPSFGTETTLKVLAFGNSFSVDSMEHLWDMIHSAGYETVILGNAHIGGCSLATHWNNMESGQKAYTFSVNTNGTWTSKTSSALEAISAEEWDVVVIQQVSGMSGLPTSYSALEEILSWLENNKPKKDTQILWNLTWAYQSGSSHADFPKYGKNQLQMYNAIIETVQWKVMPRSEFAGVIPTGIAIQNMRGSSVGDTLTRDGFHLSMGLGRYVAAMTWYCYLTGNDADTVTWVPAAYAKEIQPLLPEIYDAVQEAVETKLVATPNGPPVEDPPTDNTDPTEPEPTEPKPDDYYEHSDGKVFQNMTFTYEDLPEAFNVASTYTVQDLGKMQIEDYPIDGVYDNAFNCIKVGDTYKMWWCRACPFDTIWYAESKDMKNWYNAQMVIDLYGYSSKYMHSMLSWPSVLYVDGKYHMFFEAPGKEDEVGEYSNSIFYAMSKDGINWTFYPDNKNPQPVIKDPTPAGQRSYGVGQPKAFYKDGYFYVTYVDATTSGGNVRIARSKGNGWSFEGDVYDHTLLLEGGAGASIRYNSVTNKYYFLITASETQSNGVYNDTLFIMESEDLLNWPYKTGSQLRSKGTRLSLASNVMKKSNIDFVTDEHGIVTTENMILMWMEGVMPLASEDHRNTHTTWDGRIAVVGVGSKYDETLTLPNGKTCNKKNLEWYKNKVAKWVRPSFSIVQGTPVIDGTKDSMYNKGGTALVETVTWSYEYSKPTNTSGKVNAVWDDDALYVYAEIKDATGPYTGYALEKPGNLWRNDGITLFIDVMDTKTGTNNFEVLTPLSFMVLIDASGTLVVKDSGENVCTEEFAGYQVKTKKISGGYVIEAKVPWYPMVQSMVKEGKTIGFDVQINDSFNDTVGRQAQVYWSDYTGDSFLYLDRWGQIILK